MPQQNRWRNREFSRFAYGLFTGVFVYFERTVLVVRISLLEYSKIHEKPYKFIVCVRDACVRAIPT